MSHYAHPFKHIRQRKASHGSSLSHCVLPSHAPTSILAVSRNVLFFRRSHRRPSQSVRCSQGCLGAMMTYRTPAVNRLHRTTRNVRRTHVSVSLHVVRHVLLDTYSFLAPTRQFALVDHNQAQILISLQIQQAYTHASHSTRPPLPASRSCRGCAICHSPRSSLRTCRRAWTRP